MRVRSAAADAFLADVVELERRHGLALSHEDTHGGFVVAELDPEFHIPWLLDAVDETAAPKAEFS